MSHVVCTALIRSLLTGLTVGLMLGCTVYKSSDRDDFNSNGKARAPAQKATQALTSDDRDLLANPCAAFSTMSTDALKSIFGPTLQLSMTNQISPRTSTCLVTNVDATGATAESAISDLKTVSILTCSWKPADGSPVPTIYGAGPNEALTPQTTEDDLRANGFDFVTGSVANGETLRMNCEVYVPTSALLQDRLVSNEQGRNLLVEKYVEFDVQLHRNTLQSTTQP
jgi:hypothetical protein